MRVITNVHAATKVIDNFCVLALGPRYHYPRQMECGIGGRAF